MKYWYICVSENRSYNSSTPQKGAVYVAEAVTVHILYECTLGWDEIFVVVANVAPF